MAKKNGYHRYQGTGYIAGGSNSINTPQKIKCIGCKVVKPPAGYSSKKLELLQTHIAHQRNRGKVFNAEQQLYIPCVGCTDKQPVEMTCFYCDKTKALDKFSLAQRKKRDTAECWKCAKIREGVEPDENDSDSSGSGSGGDGSFGDDSDDTSGGVPFGNEGTSTMGSVSHANTRSTFPSSTTHSTGGGVSLGNSAPATNTYSNAGLNLATLNLGSHASSTTPSVTSTSEAAIPVAPGFNPNKYGKGPSSVAGSTTSTKTARKKNEWAKPPKPAKAKQQVSDPEDDEDKDVLDSDSD